MMANARSPLRRTALTHMTLGDLMLGNVAFDVECEKLRLMLKDAEAVETDTPTASKRK